MAIALAETMAESGHYDIDSTTVRAHVSAAGGKGGIHQRALGRSRGGFTSKSPSTSRPAKRRTAKATTR
jgi:hypothetical protein